MTVRSSPRITPRRPRPRHAPNGNRQRRPYRPVGKHCLSFDTPSPTWDEAIPLGNGLLGALVWGDGKPLKISLDRTDLWDLRPFPEFHDKDYKYTTMREWEKGGRVKDLEAMYDNPYNRPAPTKIPAGRIEMTMPDGWNAVPASL